MSQAISNSQSVRHILSIDVEDYYQVAAFADVIAPEDWIRWPSRVRQNTEKLLNVLDQHQISATFFVLGWVAEHHPEIVPMIAERGHEIACHGYSHQLIYHQSPKQFRQETERAKTLIEAQAKRPVTGYRAASYSITRHSLWALDILTELGFTWDSSIFPTHHDRYGIANSPRQPYYIDTANGSLLELPLTTAKLLGARLPAAGGGYFRQYPYWLSRELFRRAERERGCNVFYLHPWEIDPEQPRIPGASWLSRFRHYTNLKHCEHRLHRLLSDFHFTTAASVLADLAPEQRVNASEL